MLRLDCADPQANLYRAPHQYGKLPQPPHHEHTPV
jgi:hypothetical protein